MLTICCVIGPINGIGHKYEDFTSLSTYRKALVVSLFPLEIYRHKDHSFDLL